MASKQECELVKPAYRVRLFLSADLAGSTAFKSDPENEDWAAIFMKFYAGFWEMFEKNFLKLCETNGKHCGNFTGKKPKLWKTVGDEVIFVNRVESAVQVFAYMKAFKDTLKEYRLKLKGLDSQTKMDIKGNAWIASFPYPNQTFQLSSNSKSGESAIPNEWLEKGADKEPHSYDFLGKGIDYGFRIGKNSRKDFLTISPALALIICRANNNSDVSPFKFDLLFDGMNELKGVLKGAQYPIFGLNTEFDSDRKALSKLQEELGGNQEPDTEKFAKYLTKFISLHGIEEPSLKFNPTDDDADAPEFYKEFCSRWDILKAAEDQRRTNETVSANKDEGELDQDSVNEATGMLEQKLDQTK